MKRRPWQIILLAIFHVVAPVGSAFFGAWRLNMPLWDYLILLKSQAFWAQMQNFGLFPLAGLAIYSMRRWSYLVFLSVLGWSFWGNWQLGLPILQLSLVYTVNLCVVAYFMLPAIRQAYFDSRLKWWEAQTRYEFGMPAVVRGSNGKDHPISLLDFSQGGVFARWDCEDPSPQLQARLRIEVSLGGIFFVFPGTVMHCRASEPRGLGVRFDFLNWREKLQATRFVLALRILGARKKSLVSASDGRVAEIIHGFLQFLRTGKGLVPSLPPRTSSLLNRSAKKKAA